MNTFNSRRTSGRTSSFGGRPRFQSGPRSRFQSGRRSGGGFPVKKIDVTKYINTKATPVAIVPYVSKHTFADFAVEERLQANIVAKGYVTPTPIQDKAIPEIMKGHDVVGIANTGTGKTAAFLIPLIHKVLTGHNEQVLIMVPTRELATQINDEFKEFIRNMKMYSVCVVGGASIGRQISELRYFNSFIIGTPGRMKDLVNQGVIDLSKFKTVVLDEADRMLDMGFINDMKYLLAKMPADRHTLFFSATLSPDIEKLIKDFLKKPVHISVKTGDTAKNVLQDVVKVKHGSNKIDMLHDLLRGEGFEKVLVFGRTKHGVQKLSDILTKNGFSSAAIHGNKNQSQRQRALTDFKTNRAKILVATDVAARGLDIPDVSHVINFDIPATHEDYIHRIGRTGRSGKTGKALTFID